MSCETVTRRGCVFPFVHGGVKHWGCTWAAGAARPWCVTQTNLDGSHLLDPALGEREACTPGCPTEPRPEGHQVTEWDDTTTTPPPSQAVALLARSGWFGRALANAVSEGITTVDRAKEAYSLLGINTGNQKSEPRWFLSGPNFNR